MSSENLEAYIENAENYLKSYTTVAKDRQLTQMELLEACAMFRQRGICSLLLFGEPKTYHINTMQSASIYSQGIQKLNDSEIVTSRAKPFYDAIGSMYFDCAKVIAQNSSMEWKPDYEYEDDFLYVKFLMQYFFLDSGKIECEKILDGYEKSLEGANDIKLEICRSYISSDNALFEENILELLEQISDDIESKIEQETMPEEVWAGIRYFSNEGLALLRLAELKGFNTGVRYPLVPAIVRDDPKIKYNPNAWQNLDFS